MHHAPVDPQAVPSLHVAQSAVTHLTLQAHGSSQLPLFTAVFVEIRHHGCLELAFNHLI